MKIQYKQEGVQRALLRSTYQLAKESKDPSTQNGAILIDEHDRIIAQGINEFPRGVEDKPDRWERPLKYKIVEHAERNAIYQAARHGNATEGLVMICPWAACADCARAIIQAGVAGLITHKQAHDRSPEFWSQEIDIAFQMFEEAGIWVLMCDINVGVTGLLHSGKLWNP